MSGPVATLQHLPDDVIRAIIDILQFDHPTLLSCACASRQFTPHVRRHFFKDVKVQSNAAEVARIQALRELVDSNAFLLESTVRLTLNLDDGHRWIFSRILTPPFRTSDPSFYNSLRRRRADMDRTLSCILLGEFRSLRVLVLSHCNFYPVSPVVELMMGWQHVFGVPTLETVLMSDIADFPLALLGNAGENLREVGFLRVKLDRRDTLQMWSQTIATPSRRKRLRPRVFSIRDCYAETIDPIITCALNPNSFLDFSQVEQLTVHPCLAVQAPSYNTLVKAVISRSEVLTHLIWMSSTQHQTRDLEVFSADFTRFRKVDLVFVDGFGGFPELLAEIRDLLRAAQSLQLNDPTLLDSPNLSVLAGGTLGEKTCAATRNRCTSALQELTLRFDLENLTMHATPESIMPVHSADGLDTAAPGSMPLCTSGPAAASNTKSPTPSPNLYYAHLKYIWKLEEADMRILKEIDEMLAPDSHCDEEHDTTEITASIPEDGPNTIKPGAEGGSAGFANFRRLSTTCVYNPASSFMLDGQKARDVYKACKAFVVRGLPRLEKAGKLHFTFEKMRGICPDLHKLVPQGRRVVHL